MLSVDKYDVPPPVCVGPRGLSENGSEKAITFKNIECGSDIYLCREEKCDWNITQWHDLLSDNNLREDIRHVPNSLWFWLKLSFLTG